MQLLGKYQVIVDAESFAAQTRAQGEREAREIVSQAATKKAEALAKASKAAQEASHWEKTAEAMKNVLDGYGDRYLLPASSFLDNLAEEFGFDQAGQQLKAVRERVRTLVKQGAAATCDYIELNRRTTAVAFVLDAFNGKVDTVLADVRHDNMGILSQKIQDAFQLVNHNGKAFRNARVTPEYLAARLEELRWAAVAQELKRKEREEQRLLKEKIREEEKAQKEYERASKEPEKEEEAIRKAMTKAMLDIERASDAQRDKYETQLQELTQKLKAAEEKNRRALSMAQQTKTGHVYVISNVGSFGEHVYKIWSYTSA